MTAPKLTEEEARAELLRPATGKCVVVVKGRKVPRDTTGIVFWEGEGGLHNQGARIGFKDAAGTAHWTAAHNVVVVVPGFDPPIASNDKPPAGHTWNELLQAHTPEVPSKGQQVRIKETSEEGEVFWVKGHRLGVRVGSGKDDVRWADASEVEVVKDKLQILQDFANGIGTPPPLGQGVSPLPPTVVPVIPHQPQPPSTGLAGSVYQRWSLQRAGLLSLPLIPRSVKYGCLSGKTRKVFMRGCMRHTTPMEIFSSSSRMRSPPCCNVGTTSLATK